MAFADTRPIAATQIDLAGLVAEIRGLETALASARRELGLAAEAVARTATQAGAALIERDKIERRETTLMGALAARGVPFETIQAAWEEVKDD